jgi:hypothetical protein
VDSVEVERHDAEQAMVTRLSAQVEALASSERELRRLLNGAHGQVAARDEEVSRLLGELARGRERDRAVAEATLAYGQLAELRATRLYRAARLWWRVRHRLRSR